MLKGLPRRARDSGPRTTGLHPSEPAPDVIGNRFEILSQLGAGGMGRVFAAFDRVLKRQVAVKELAPHLAGSAPFSELMLREARAAAQLSHENIIAVYDVVTDGDTVFIVMELLRGETLAAGIARAPSPLRRIDPLLLGRIGPDPKHDRDQDRARPLTNGRRRVLERGLGSLPPGGGAWDARSRGVSAREVSG